MSKKIILYGPSKIGISKFLSNIPYEDVVYLVPYPGQNVLEKRYINIKKEVGIQSFTEENDKIDVFINALKSILLLQDPPYKFMVIEHLTAIEYLISNLHMSVYNVNSMEYFSYNRGHLSTFSMLQKILYLLDEIAKKKKITIFLTAHATKQTYSSIFIENASRDIILSSIKLPDATVHEHLKIWSDALLYVNNTCLATGGFLSNASIDVSSNVSIFTREQPNFDAGCRYEWPLNIDLDWNTFHEKYLKGDK